MCTFWKVKESRRDREKPRKAGKIRRKRRKRMSRRLHKPGEGEGAGQVHSDSL